MKPYLRKTAAFSLVEVVIAIGIVSLALLPLLGLLPVGLNSNRSSTTQTGAMSLITAISADIRSTTATTGVSPRFGIRTTASGGQTLYFDESETVTGLQPGKPGYKADIEPVKISTTMTALRVTVSWPPQASGGNVLGSADVIVPVDNN
ncbi:Verru_Chthon cassette protein B [Verrucomicrobium sp. GAS474]|uniref:Verru_Chthon cassette protein B n=1 Tax=Verrucomicrobium sp. GAS474 TaxID=1882831 RepID=UPI00087BA117|nr:Verru_Chthon cassette protein B [Verrucomicrobium sp. GAS474]SDU17962.1 Verru_Chthon cassette protein B [Verrucomicrobium sp. GAS474]